MKEYIIDANKRRFGRLAGEIAVLLLGKNEPDFAANRVADVKVKVLNAGKLEIGGRKMKKKIYYRHTGYMGHLKEQTFEMAFKKSPENVLRETVRHMLPKNFLNQKRLNNLIMVEE
jgi:large subunit ribosomal protein L13